MDLAVVGDGPAGRDQRLPGHLAAEHPGRAVRRAHPAEQVELELLEVEQLDELVEDGLAARPAVGGGLDGNGHAEHPAKPRVGA